MAAGDIYQCTVVQGLDGVNLANVMFLKIIDDTGIADSEIGVNEVFDNQIIPAMVNIQSEDVSYECVLMRKVAPMTAPARVFPSTKVGLLPFPSIAANQVAVMSHYSNDGRPRYRGRYFISGTPKTISSHGRISETFKGIYDELADLMTETITESTHTYRMQHYSKFLDVHVDIENARMQPILTKHRGRTPGTCSIT